MWKYPSTAHKSSSVQCHRNAVQCFSAGFHQSTRVKDRSTKEEKGENKKLKDMSFIRVGVCDSPQNDGVCGFLTLATYIP